MFDTVLVANRGEIAVRVIRTLRRMGIRSVAVYSDADAGGRHVREADVAVRIGPAAAAESYLSAERILDAARRTGAAAVHPGYGFLAENAAFATACAAEGLVFVGPPAAAIEAMGDKIRAKQTVTAAGVPVVPGRTEPGMTDDDLVAAAGEIGYPVLLKPSAGGGGKGMRLVHAKDELLDAIESARREARGAFGDGTLLVERFVTDPRHIEIQVLADAHGNVVHLGERECSLQRRHQKIVEEAPSPLLDPATRHRMGQAAVDAAKAVGYVGAGTVEFVVPGHDPAEFFFMEMNTRLQVEHPVTELVTGLDLVEWQIRVAAGERLGFAQEDVRLDGHAVEARIYAEDPTRGFLPTGGRVLALREPEDLVRVDSGLVEGAVVTSDYDPMLAKYVAHAGSREDALRLLRAGLGGAVMLGVVTNVPFLRALLSDVDVVAGRLDTGLVERRLADLVTTDVPEHVLAAAGLERLAALEPAGGVVDPWDVPGGWRIGEPAWATWRIEVAGRDAVEVRVRGRACAAEVAVGGGEPVPARVERHGTDLLVDLAGRVRRYAMARDGQVLWLGAGGRVWALTETGRLAAARHETAASAGPVTSPMPGTVLVVRVARGERVRAGQPMLVVEAMKMEHTLVAPIDGVVAELDVRAGTQVALDQRLALVLPEETQATPDRG
ncbi:acetyl-CoA carboxylase biotin carboxylase subunit [Gandjariella thermophila]|uniref:Biotin-dependent 3-methylcrotonyl-coenzyme A carboxylase alpha1 subunit n=1 Tax=Gandjariella thermophila TaxID=1931992 RepID=A0A4D4JB44_9PSEU|nr:acetyl/propionyl/methylcrotonyl-CoA carboxylase subunit alpha [Gandjariella thermophila]GDY32230.1 acetyl/propionyl-CoA carboxylase subunit alpha [Gandjariella thermophila]